MGCAHLQTVSSGLHTLSLRAGPENKRPMGCFPSVGGVRKRESSTRSHSNRSADQSQRTSASRVADTKKGPKNKGKIAEDGDSPAARGPEDAKKMPKNKEKLLKGAKEGSNGSPERRKRISEHARAFNFYELTTATDNFRRDNLLGHGGFGKVYKGTLADTGKSVAVKQLIQGGSQGNKEFLIEVLTLSLSQHPNLVKLIGYCAEGRERLLVYEFMPLGSLDTHLYDPQPDQKILDWETRMRIAVGVARGLEFLHAIMEPPMIYRDMKCANILLGEGYHPKLSDFGLAKVGPRGNKKHVSTRIMGTYGYFPPEYVMTGHLTFMSDIYSFGVVLLELVTGRKAYKASKNKKDEYLIDWARPMFKDARKHSLMVDPALQGQYPSNELYQAIGLGASCVTDKPTMRPHISSVVNALDLLGSNQVKRTEKGEARIGGEREPPASGKEINGAVPANESPGRGTGGAGGSDEEEDVAESRPLAHRGRWRGMGKGDASGEGEKPAHGGAVARSEPPGSGTRGTSGSDEEESVKPVRGICEAGEQRASGSARPAGIGEGGVRESGRRAGARDSGEEEDVGVSGQLVLRRRRRGSGRREPGGTGDGGVDESAPPVSGAGEGNGWGWGAASVIERRGSGEGEASGGGGGAVGETEAAVGGVREGGADAVAVAEDEAAVGGEGRAGDSGEGIIAEEKRPGGSDNPSFTFNLLTV